MPSTSTYSPTGDPYLDGVLTGIKWGTSTLTFSFPTDSALYGSNYGSGEQLNNFEAFTAAQQTAVRSILEMYSSVANIGFSEVTETSSVHGDLRYAESDATGTAWAYYPSTYELGGDAWFNNSKNYYDNPSPGNYGWLTMMHETGHALGLKHPHEWTGSFLAMPADKDSLEYTVMSYRSYVGGPTTGFTNGATSYPQTLMMYDIAAVQKMYGADYTTNAGSTVYSWSAATGQMSIDGVGQWMPSGNKVFMTLWDGGGNDTYDLSNYGGGVKVDLNPGGWTTTALAQLADLASGKLAVGNIANALLFNGNTASLIENAIGGAGNDTILGNVADNTLTGGAGSDVLDGRLGNDTAVFSGHQADYSWVQSGDSWTVTDLRSSSPDGLDTLTNIEFLQFSDTTVTILAPSTPPPVVPIEPLLPTNTAPLAQNDAYSVAKGKSLTVAALSGLLKNDADPDGDALHALLVSGPGKGSLKLAADGSLVYTPAKNFAGSVSFTYLASDGANNSNLATVTIVVGATTTTVRGHGGGWIGEDQAPAPRTSVLHSSRGEHGSNNDPSGHHNAPSFEFDHHDHARHLTAFHDFV